MADHAVDFWLLTEDLPNPDNRVTVDRDKSPVDERPGELFGVERREHGAKGVMAGHAAGQLQKPAPPRFFLLAEACQRRELFLPAEHRAKGDHQNVSEPVPPPVQGVRIIQSSKP